MQGLAEAKSKDYKLRLLDPKKTTDERGFWELLNLVLPVFLIIIFGFIYQWIRKRKYLFPSQIRSHNAFSKQTNNSIFIFSFTTLSLVSS